jgi:hypothetical protein
VGKERVCSVLKLQLWVMKFTVNLQQEIVRRTHKYFIIDLPKKARLPLVQRGKYIKPTRKYISLDRTVWLLFI